MGDDRHVCADCACCVCHAPAHGRSEISSGLGGVRSRTAWRGGLSDCRDGAGRSCPGHGSASRRHASLPRPELFVDAGREHDLGTIADSVDLPRPVRAGTRYDLRPRGDRSARWHLRCERTAALIILPLGLILFPRGSRPRVSDPRQSGAKSRPGSGKIRLINPTLQCLCRVEGIRSLRYPNLRRSGCSSRRLWLADLATSRRSDVPPHSACNGFSIRPPSPIPSVPKLATAVLPRMRPQHAANQFRRDFASPFEAPQASPRLSCRRESTPRVGRSG